MTASFAATEFTEKKLENKIIQTHEKKFVFCSCRFFINCH